MSEADLLIGNEEYDKEEIDRRRTLVLNNPHLYLTKKKNLKDAAIIARKKHNPSVLDLCATLPIWHWLMPLAAMSTTTSQRIQT